MLQQRWLLIVLAGLLGTTVGLIVAGSQTPKYTAAADVFVTVANGQSSGELAQSSTFSQDQANNFAAVVPKQIVLDPVIKELGLDISIDDLRKTIDVEVPLNTSLITISVVNKDPKLAAALANSIAHHLSTAVSTLTPTVSDVSGAPVRVDVIESATVPEEPTSPVVALFAMIGLLLGLALAIAYVVIVELVVARVDSAEQVEALTGSAVLANVPRDRKVSRHPIAVTALPLSLRAEAIRHARTALKFLPGEGNQTFVITSAVSGEGKSTTAANIAAAFAAEGLSTCLVEADLRRPRLEGLLDLTGGPGLSDIVVGQCQIDDVVQPWGPDNLNVILVGTVPPNASELLGSTRGQDALKEIAKKFEVTIIDSPPMTAVTDAAIIGRIFDGVVMVVGGGKVRTSELRQAVSALTVADVPIRGVVMNLAKDDASRPYAYAYSDRNRGSKFSGLLPQGWRPVLKVAAAILAAAAVVVATVLMTNRTTQVSSAAATPMSSVTTTGAIKAVFIGDSLVQGAGGSPDWVDLVSKNMGWTPINLGRGGTGYSTSTTAANACGLKYCPTFGEMATTAIEYEPDVVVISGGQNDGTKDVSADAQSLFKALRAELPSAKIIVMSPLWRATSYPDSLSQIRAEVKAAAAKTGVTYVDVGNPLEGKPDKFITDGVHPTADGYSILADTITKAFRKL